MLNPKESSVKVLLTGVTGFVGHHVLEHFMKSTNWQIIGTYRNSIAGDFRRLDELLVSHPEWNSRLTLLHADFRDAISPTIIADLGKIDGIIHVAANSHVDRSIINPKEFLVDNALGTLNLLEAAKELKPKLFLYFSTDEVYGNAPDGINHTEEFPHRPRNPYAASKAAAEDFCYAYQVTYNIPLIITNTMNIIGERQDKEKFVPKIMRSILNEVKLSIHAHPDKKRAGQRHYLHARNAAAALLYVLQYGEIGERYNIVGEEEIDNLEMAFLVHRYMKVDQSLVYELVDFHSSRPGHDLRYSLDGTKLNTLGYIHPISFKESLKKTVEWTMDNKRWLL